MKRILVATDFSQRSDRAIRRAQLLANEFDAQVRLVHVVDDDQATKIMLAERAASITLLQELSDALVDVDGIDCDFRVVIGRPFLGIKQAAQEFEADLIVVGSHRRQVLWDILIGTTVERTIRNSDRPILMVSAVPSGPYRHALAGTDLSAYSEATFRTAKSLELLQRLSMFLVHVFNVTGSKLMSRASLDECEKESYVAVEREHARDEIQSFIDKIGAERMLPLVEPSIVNVAETISTTAQEHSADLLVMGTSGRSAIGRALMGSVTEEVLRSAQCDVLVIPAPRNVVAGTYEGWNGNRIGTITNVPAKVSSCSGTPTFKKSINR